MSIYTVPPLDGVDFSLVSVTPGSVTNHASALVPYTAPALASVDFALVAYTLPTFSGIDFELGEADGDHQVAFDVFANSQSFAPLAMNGQIALSAFANAGAFAPLSLQAEVSFGSFTNAHSFGAFSVNGTISLESYSGAQGFGAFSVGGQIALAAFENQQEFASFEIEGGSEPEAEPSYGGGYYPIRIPRSHLIGPTHIRNRQEFFRFALSHTKSDAEAARALRRAREESDLMTLAA